MDKAISAIKKWLHITVVVSRKVVETFKTIAKMPQVSEVTAAEKNA